MACSPQLFLEIAFSAWPSRWGWLSWRRRFPCSRPGQVGQPQPDAQAHHSRPGPDVRIWKEEVDQSPIYSLSWNTSGLKNLLRENAMLILKVFSLFWVKACGSPPVYPVAYSFCVWPGFSVFHDTDGREDEPLDGLGLSTSTTTDTNVWSLTWYTFY